MALPSPLALASPSFGPTSAAAANDAQAIGPERIVGGIVKVQEDVVKVEARENRDISMTLLFDRGQSLEERILREQFDY